MEKIDKVDYMKDFYSQHIIKDKVQKIFRPSTTDRRLILLISK